MKSRAISTISCQYPPLRNAFSFRPAKPAFFIGQAANSSIEIFALGRDEASYSVSFSLNTLRPPSEIHKAFFAWSQDVFNSEKINSSLLPSDRKYRISLTENMLISPVKKINRPFDFAN
jgi:hypothetical protein